jgi:hypothetical protein
MEKSLLALEVERGRDSLNKLTQVSSHIFYTFLGSGFPKSYPLLPVTKFIVPVLGDKVDFGIGLSYRPTRLHRMAGR